MLYFSHGFVRAQEAWFPDDSHKEYATQIPFSQ